MPRIDGEEKYDPIEFDRTASRIPDILKSHDQIVIEREKRTVTLLEKIFHISEEILNQLKDNKR